MSNLGQDLKIDTENRQTIMDQSTRMRDIIAYHIRRASVTGVQPLGPAIALKPLLLRLSTSLKKVYAQRSIKIDIKISEHEKLRVDEADLMEIFGNLLENACKYGASRIKLYRLSEDNSKHIIYRIDDNGPGFPDDVTDALLQRGARADTRIDGQGLGLAVSSELLSAYGAKLTLARADKDYNGARVTLYFSATM
jgi:two-component system sensor histidine kinase PhoQ